MGCAPLPAHAPPYPWVGSACTPMTWCICSAPLPLPTPSADLEQTTYLSQTCSQCGSALMCRDGLITAQGFLSNYGPLLGSPGCPFLSHLCISATAAPIFSFVLNVPPLLRAALSRSPPFIPETPRSYYRLGEGPLLQRAAGQPISASLPAMLTAELCLLISSPPALPL